VCLYYLCIGEFSPFAIAYESLNCHYISVKRAGSVQIWKRGWKTNECAGPGEIFWRTLQTDYCKNITETIIHITQDTVSRQYQYQLLNIKL